MAMHIVKQLDYCKQVYLWSYIPWKYSRLYQYISWNGCPPVLNIPISKA